MLTDARMPSRFVGMTAAEFVVVGLSFKPVMEPIGNRSRLSSLFDLKFKIGDVDKPLDIVSVLQVSQQKLLN